MSKAVKVCFGILLLAVSSPLLAQQCIPVDHGTEEYIALNQFWGTNIPICQIAPGNNNAFADRNNRVVWADQNWLDSMASRYGSFAATGILAHEWGHMVQGPISGTAAELQADCLAGVFMRGRGLPEQAVIEFATANWFAGDAEMSLGGHGTGLQRRNAALRGYTGFQPAMNVYQLVQLCPASFL